VLPAGGLQPGVDQVLGQEAAHGGFEGGEPRCVQFRLITGPAGRGRGPGREAEEGLFVAERVADAVLDEVPDLVEVAGGEVVDAVQHEDRPGRPPGQHAEQFPLPVRERRVGGEDDDGAVGAEQLGLRRLGVVAEHRPQPRGVDQGGSGPEDLGRHPDLGPVHATLVVRVAFLGHELGQPGQLHLLRRTVEVVDAELVGSVGDLGGDGGEGERPGGKQVAAEQGVEQRRLPPFELAHHADKESAGLQPTREFAGPVGEVGGDDRGQRDEIPGAARQVLQLRAVLACGYTSPPVQEEPSARLGPGGFGGPHRRPAQNTRPVPPRRPLSSPS
jgi:hypothetical protein